MKKKLAVLLVFLLATTVYFVFYHKDKTLKYIPENADVIVLADVKNLTRQYISNLAMHPDQWFNGKSNGKNTISIQESGVKIPDFFQVFHIKNTSFSQWYSVLELKDKQQFLKYLQQQKFIRTGKEVFQKEQIFIKIDGKRCIIGTSDLNSVTFYKLFFQNLGKVSYNADSFIDAGIGSISFKGPQIKNFSIDLFSDEIIIKNNSDSYDPAPVISTLQQTKAFLETELDQENIRTFASFFNKSLSDSSHVTHIKAAATLEKVNDTIITYGYDDNFNEIEKKTVQKIIQPDYVIALQSSAVEKTQQYFQHKKWMNARNQFTAIPFQPNIITRTGVGFEIKSTRKPVPSSPLLKENFIFIRNSALLSSSFKSLTAAEKKIISGVDYIFYGNRNEDYYLSLKFKKEELPLILRW
ncbi:hypothetical protein SD427_18120 [Chryseobacterium sp. JJR-5R]|uniref:hypothetical protein n=1 Tax=Chryseobacterium sp. JJR-5R TaxID=3093923 RepID=UPI002A7575E3|nr:hypothetical protein [Chryseobacterium sp. JJR-5R]WPO82656.1 hypothetical protein SD427_18120 [Chryseobacterium sp. JJR-5R]